MKKSETTVYQISGEITKPYFPGMLNKMAVISIGNFADNLKGFQMNSLSDLKQSKE